MRDYQTKDEEREGFMEGHNHPWAEGLLCSGVGCQRTDQCALHDGGVVNHTRFYYAPPDPAACPAFKQRP